jgi:cAMP-specific phosphodiesterase 4
MDTTASDELHGHERWAGWVEPAVANSSPEDKTLVMQLLLKCADLGNVVRPLEMADAWGKRIMEEFYQQGEKELALGLPLTTFPNRKNFDYIFARHQNGFLVNVVKPLFETFTQLTDDETRESVLSSAAENGDAWSQRENANRPGANKLARKRSDKGTPMGSLVQRSRSSFSNARSSSTRFRGSSQHWLRSFKESNLTMLTSNAMEMKGLEITLEENYGAGDEVRAATRLCLPFIPRLELIRLAELGLLGMSDGTIGSSKRLPFLKAQGGRHLPLQVRIFFYSRIGD